MAPLLSPFLHSLRTWHQDKVAPIDHRAVAKDVYREGEISGGYFLTLTIANLIALCGLLTNSMPVIIGAMLISPLMGPILSFGYAFITGEQQIWRSSVRKITMSVALTIGVAALATFVSPLTGLTTEILSRTRPNLYDLVVAFLAGLVGAVALCTKKNFLTVVPGVAIATAVIPPLSVAGFGAGIADPKIAVGGFLLFFTNLVAIIIATCLIFSFYGFRTNTATQLDPAQLKRRSIYLGFVLVVLAIPLAHTLYSSIAEVRLHTSIRNALQQEFNRPQRSSLNSFTFLERRPDLLELNVLLNAVEYLNDEEVRHSEKQLARTLRRQVSLHLEQVKVQAGGLKKQPLQPTVPSLVPARPPFQVVQEARQETITAVRQATAEVEKVIAPAVVEEFHIGFAEKDPALTLMVTLRREQPLSETEMEWVKQLFMRELGQPVTLQITVVPPTVPH